MRFWLLTIGIAACTAPSSMIGDAVPIFDDPGVIPIDLPAMRPSDPAPSVGGYEIRELPIDKRLLHASHVVATTIAATDDGRTAVTVDAVGGTKLWPTLDGTREPIVISTSRPTMVALVRTGDQFVVIGLDGTGALEIIRTTTRGEVLAHRQIITPRPIAKLRATSAGIVALRDDQRLELLDLDGARRGVLAPEPGERIHALIARRDRVLAVIGSADGVHARWLDVRPEGWAWGAATPKLPIDPDTAVLSPDLRHIAANAARGTATLYLDLVTGKSVRVPPPPENEFGPDVAMTPRGFTSASQLALDGQFGSTMWWSGETTTVTFAGDPERESMPMPIAIGDRCLLVGSRSRIMLHTAEEGSKWVGYELLNPIEVRATTRGGFVIGGYAGRNLVRTDAQLRETHPIEWRIAQEVHELKMLDHRYAAAIVGAYKNFSLVRLDIEDPEDIVTVAPVNAYALVYEPSSHVLAYLEDHDIVFARFDPKTGTIGPPVRSVFSKFPYASSVILTNPALANGIIGLAEEVDGDGAHIHLTEIRAICATCDEPVVTGRERTIEYADRPAVLQRYGIGIDGRLASAVSPDKTAIARIENGRLALLDANGHERWVVPSRGAASVAWSTAGDLVLVGNGLAHVDRETGSITGAQCGWRFGLHEGTESDFMFGPTLCDAP